MKKALIFYGGWPGHTPKETSMVFAGMLKNEGFALTITDNMQIFDSCDNILEFDLLVPNITMGDISNTQCENISKAVAAGAGMAGCHGGMCDAFRNSSLWQFITGAQWVAHPGNSDIEYEVELLRDDELTFGIDNFKIKTEQYYLHIDPAVKVHATTTFPVSDGEHASNGIVKMPVIFTKKWGKGKIYYNSLGHTYEIFSLPQPRELMRRGFLWASR